jgi:hypothetical protein
MKSDLKNKLLLFMMVHVIFIIAIALHMMVLNTTKKLPDFLFIVIGCPTIAMIYINAYILSIKYLYSKVFKKLKLFKEFNVLNTFNISDNSKLILFLFIMVFVILMQAMLIFSKELRNSFII